MFIIGINNIGILITFHVVRHSRFKGGKLRHKIHVKDRVAQKSIFQTWPKAVIFILLIQ